MTSRYDPFKDDTLGTPEEPPIPQVRKNRKPPVKIDWKRAARLMAEGHRPDAVAAMLDIEEEHIWRHLKRSLRFQFYLRQALERQRLLACLELSVAGAATVVAHARRPEGLEGADLHWLADRAGLMAPAKDAAGSDDADRDLAAQLGETGRLPRGASRPRKRRGASPEERAEHAALLAAFGSGNRDRKPQQVASDSPEPYRNPAGSSEPQRSAADAGECQRTGMDASEPPRTALDRDDQPLRPAPRIGVTHPPTVVDLDGPDLRRLRAEGALSEAPEGRYPRIYSEGPPSAASARAVPFSHDVGEGWDEGGR